MTNNEIRNNEKLDNELIQIINQLCYKGLSCQAMQVYREIKHRANTHKFLPLISITVRKVQGRLNLLSKKGRIIRESLSGASRNIFYMPVREPKPEPEATLTDQGKRERIKRKIAWNHIKKEYQQTNGEINGILAEIKNACTWEHHCNVLSPEMDRLLSTREMLLWDAICELRKEKADLDLTELYCRLNGRGIEILNAIAIKNLIETMDKN